jgi:hypothetical protein
MTARVYVNLPEGICSSLNIDLEIYCPTPGKTGNKVFE